jgi:hypothetical protein
MARSYAPIQIYEAKQTSVNLLDTPEDFYMHNRRYSASTILNITYGRRIPQCIPLEIHILIQGTVKRFARYTLFSKDFQMSVAQEHISLTHFPNWRTSHYSIWCHPGVERGTSTIVKIMRRTKNSGILCSRR